MKVVHVTTTHPPDDVRIWLKECRTLAKEGYEVVLAAPVHEASERDGVLVKPVGVTSLRAGIPDVARRLAAVLRTVRRESADVYHLHDPELIPVGLALKLSGARIVYDAHEDTAAEVLTSRGKSQRVLALHARVWTAAEGVAGAAFDGIVAATPRIAGKFPERKTALVRNFARLQELETLDAGLPYGDRPPEFVYVGQLSTPRGIRELVDAIGRVSADEATTLVLAGSVHAGEPKLLDEVRRAPGWARVRYEGVLPRTKARELLGRSRGGLVLFRPEPNHLEALPNKLFEYMSAGLPVVASDFPFWRTIVGRERCGLLVSPTDPAAIAAAIDRLLLGTDEAQAMGERGRNAVRRSYNWEAESAALLGLYETVRWGSRTAR